MTAPDEFVPLAAEFALGVLDGAERAEAMRRMLADPVFAREVEGWRMRLAALFAEWPEAAAAETLERRVIASVEASAVGASVEPIAPPRRNVWAWATGAAVLVAACLVLVLALRPVRTVPLPVAPTAIPAPLVAAIAPKSGAPFAALYDARRGELRLTGTVAVPAARSAELWAIGPDAKPRPLGLLAADRPRVSLTVAAARTLADGVTLAVSIEPVGGSPTGSPTGPVVATGTLSAG